MTGTAPKPPKSLASAGRKLWSAVVGDYELEEHESLLLLEACRTADQLDALDVLVQSEGLTVVTPQGVRAHPAVVEARQLRVALARLLAALRLPAGDEDSADYRRAQRRGAPRGVYGPRPRGVA